MAQMAHETGSRKTITKSPTYANWTLTNARYQIGGKFVTAVSQAMQSSNNLKPTNLGP